eukprot:m.67413 g.67413  ORF g.67413 m.67413 type:complete len:291 (+) comp11887_c0_seq1:1805-2677(+)
MVAEAYHVSVATHTLVTNIQPAHYLSKGANLSGFKVHFNNSFSRCGTIYSRFVVWAGGTYHNPIIPTFPGASLTIHYGHLSSWNKVPIRGSGPTVIIGGGESGMEAAYNMISLGRTSHVVICDGASPWTKANSLTGKTKERLRWMQSIGAIKLISTNVVVVTKGITVQGPVFDIKLEYGEHLQTGTPPIAATGFSVKSAVIKDLFAWDEVFATPIINSDDESTVTRGVFLAGSGVSHNREHEKVAFDSIYKFRTRFAVVAKSISQRIGTWKGGGDRLREYQLHNMYYDDI